MGAAELMFIDSLLNQLLQLILAGRVLKLHATFTFIYRRLKMMQRFQQTDWTNYHLLLWIRIGLCVECFQVLFLQGIPFVNIGQ